MMRSLIAIAALLASVYASAGELDGKALVCKREDYGQRMLGLEFNDGAVREHFVAIRGTRAEMAVKENDGDGARPSYTTYTKSVLWRMQGNPVSLNRETLSLTVKSPLSSATYWTAACSGPVTVKEMEGVMETYRQVRQREVDEETKNNKI